MTDPDQSATDTEAQSEQADAAPTEAATEAGERREVPADLAWAQGFHMAARAFATERKAEEIHITITLASGEEIPIISVGPGGPPGFVGFGVETEGLREQIEDSEKAIPSPRGVYVPIGSIAKVEFSSEPEAERAVGFYVDSDLDPA